VKEQKLEALEAFLFTTENQELEETLKLAILSPYRAKMQHILSQVKY